MSSDDELWIPLVDEPIGAFVDALLAEHADLAQAVASPRRLLAFRTFTYLRVGMLLGRLLVESDVDTSTEGSSWVERMLEEPAVRAQAVAEVRAVAEEIAADPAPTTPSARASASSPSATFRLTSSSLRGRPGT
jgi:hypothetical protein